MLGKDSNVVVVGAGGIGGITAALMKMNGYHVEIVCKYPELAEKIKSEGLHILGAHGKHDVPLPAVAKITELEGKKDIVFLATKATDMIEAAEQLLPYLSKDSMVVSMQNGICEEALAEVLGKERTIGCVVGWGATMHDPGKLEMTSTGDFIIGNIIDLPTERLLPVKEMLQTVVPATISNNIFGNLYAKLIINSCITSLGAICGMYLGEMLKSRKIRNIFIEIMFEAVAVADAMDLKLEAMAGLDYDKFIKGQGAISRLRRHFILRVIGFKFRRLKSSSLQSLERGKPTEIDYFNGYIEQKAKEHGVKTPVNSKIVEIIRDIETGKKRIEFNNFNDLAFDAF
jgi:2-dehydropantoate 2-reductase